MTILKKLAIYVAAGAVTACSAPQKVVYVPEAESIPAEVLAHSQPDADPVLAVGDLLNIRVISPDMAAAAPFNRNMYANANGEITFKYSNGTSSDIANADYDLVNTDGVVEFPLIGDVEVAGKTKEQVAQIIRAGIYPKYLKQEPTVEIRLMNFRVTVLGAVKTPGQYLSQNERLNVLEAIALAGDLDIKGERENIMLYRTNPDGTREIHRLNLNDKNILLSPYFTLRQNDILYVQPNKSARQASWQMPQGWTTTISVVGGISAVAALVVSIINISN